MNGFAPLSNTGKTVTNRKSIAENFDTFLQLLTTQLRNQNPFDPLDTSEFTNQLVQFSGVEQTIATNKHLETISNLSATNMAIATVSYIGKTIIADGSVKKLENGQTSWIYKAQAEAPKSTMIIRDEKGKTILSREIDLKAGTHEMVWDGKDNSKIPLPEGNYRLELIGKNHQGGYVRVDTAVSGYIDGIDLSEAEPILKSGNKRIRLSTIKHIGQAPVISE
ncbi:MAG: flagellar hook capping FlgD N-terminal domain-containing protein [Alphaproteobacteria bacterium]|nr:flagellar hook capping FlgD N-terminal domain-containing protein [Alphaproteobacteria bacterium]